MFVIDLEKLNSADRLRISLRLSKIKQVIFCGIHLGACGNQEFSGGIVYTEVHLGDVFQSLNRTLQNLIRNHFATLFHFKLPKTAFALP